MVNSLIHRRELADKFSDWLARRSNVTTNVYNYTILLDEARRRGLAPHNFLEAMLDDVLDAYANQSNEEIQKAWEETPQQWRQGILGGQGDRV